MSYKLDSEISVHWQWEWCIIQQPIRHLENCNNVHAFRFNYQSPLNLVSSVSHKQPVKQQSAIKPQEFIWVWITQPWSCVEGNEIGVHPYLQHVHKRGSCWSNSTNCIPFHAAPPPTAVLPQWLGTGSLVSAVIGACIGTALVYTLILLVWIFWNKRHG